MKKDFIFVGSISVFILLTLVLMAQFFLKRESDVIPIVEEVPSLFVADQPQIDGVGVKEGGDKDTTVGEGITSEVAAAPTTKAVDLIPEKLECIVIDNFTGESPQLRWFVVNDGVMGGLSQGSVSYEQDMLVHTGVLNTNGGGFSYAGARLPENILTGSSRLQVRMNTYGRQYAVNFGDARNWRISHQTRIPIGPEDSWQEVLIDFDQTVPTVFSRQVDSEPFAASAINELSFILGDGKDGPFRMEIDWIKACI